MRILVVSDTHGHLEEVQHVVEHLGNVDLILHAGDHYRDTDDLAYYHEIPARGVMGNCDFPGDGPLEDILDVAGYRIFITHGHRYGVHRNTDRLMQRARELNAQIIIYGHTHIPDHRVEENILILNPGSLVKPRGGSKPSFGLIDINADHVEAHIFTLDYHYPERLASKRMQSRTKTRP